MKKIYFTILILIISIMTYAQIGNSNDQCTNCKNNTVETSKFSSAIGSDNTSTGQKSFAGGMNTEATGDYSFAFGKNTLSQGNYSIALIEQANASGQHSFAAGYSALAQGNASFALGAYAEATGSMSYAAGRLVKASNQFSFVFGNGLIDNPLENNIENSLMIGFNSNIPTLFVGPSNGTNTTGFVGIGTSTPNSMLEVNGTFRVNDYANFQYVEMNGLSLNGSMDITQHDIIQINSLKGANGLDLYGSSGVLGISIQDNGYVGIRNNNPEHALDVTGDIVFSNNLYHDNQLLGQWNKEGNDIHYDAGKVGIGTSTPVSTLDVVGDINFTDELLHNGEIFKSSLWGENGNNIYYNDGNIGIGTDNPSYKLQVAGNTKISSTLTAGNIKVGPGAGGNAKLTVSVAATNNAKLVVFTNESDHKMFFVPQLGEGGYNYSSEDGDFGLFWNDGGAGGQNENAAFVLAPHKNNKGGIRIDKDGNVEMGNAIIAYANGNFWAREVRVNLNEPDWPDFVFDDDYQLTSLQQTEKFIEKHNHLPGVPSKEEVKQNGVNLAEMDAILLQKIEELTLHIIELEKEVNSLKP